MAVIKKDGGFMPLPINIKRGNPIPLDSTSIWYDYDALVTYASTSTIAYVGQIVTYVNETDNTSTVYVISDTAGTLLEVGSGAGGDAVNVDEHTIVLDDQGLLTLRDFGSKYYRYIAAHEDESGAEVPVAYVLQEVNDEYPWKAGLIPQVTLDEDGTTFILGWYEPNPTTVDGLQTAITALQTEVAGVKSNLTNNYYTKEEAQAEFAGATHYRGSVETEDDLPETAESGDIYIVKETSTEYIYDGQKWEELGSPVDLSSFETRVGTLETDVSSLKTTVGTLNTSIANLESRTGTLESSVKIAQTNIGTLRTDVDGLASIIGTASGTDAEGNPIIASGILGSLENLQNQIGGLDYINGVRINGTDVPESDGKALLYDFTKSQGLAGLVPVPSAGVVADTDNMYVLTAQGNWAQPMDSRIGNLTFDGVTYTTVTEYVDARSSSMTMTWSAISDN